MNTVNDILRSKIQALKEQFSTIADEYLAHYERAQVEKVLKIDQVEEYLIALKAQANHLFHETTTEMLSAIETDLIEKKKIVRIVEKD